MTRRPIRRHQIRVTRDFVLFCVGLSIIIEQTLIASAATERPVLLGLAAAMVGVPVYWTLAKREEDEEA